jgi:DNA-binding GntR family transcriptional regulator
VSKQAATRQVPARERPSQPHRSAIGSLPGLSRFPAGLLRSKRVDTDGIFEAVRHRISILDYAPGTALKEVELAAEFGVSRTPIRQVLQRLELAGLVQPVVGHGSIVAPIDLDSVRQVMEFRLQLALLLEHFFDLARPEPILRRLAGLERRQRSLARPMSYAAFAEISHAARACVMERIVNPFVARSWIDTYFLSCRLWFMILDRAPEQFARIQLEEIQAFRRAFASGEPGRLAEAIHLQLRKWVDAMWAALRPG